MTHLVLRAVRTVRRPLRQLSARVGLGPTHAVIRELTRRGVPLGTLQALEVFGGRGVCHTNVLARRVARLEAWEHDPACEADLRRNVPSADVRITDSYREIRDTSGRYDLVSIDNAELMFGPHCEHFDLFPDVFRVMAAEAIVVLNVVSAADRLSRWKAPAFFDAAHLERRRAFYQTDCPERVPLDRLAATYRTLSEAHGFRVEWHFFRKRTLIPVYFLVLKLSRTNAPSASAT